MSSNGRSTSRSTPPVLTSSGEDELKFGYPSTDLLADLPPVLTSSGEDEFKFDRSAGRSTPSTDI